VTDRDIHLAIVLAMLTNLTGTFVVPTAEYTFWGSRDWLLQIKKKEK